MNSLFVDILGALIGLITVLLMLSMVVTALVQATQGVLRLRSRNLLFGLTSVITQHADTDRENAKMKAREILNTKSSPAMEGVFDPKGSVVKFLGPQVSWIDKQELAKMLGECSTILDVQVRENILAGWDTIQKSLSKRFLRNIRIWTIFWSLVVAVIFQVSAPALLSDLLRSQGSQEITAQMPSKDQTREDMISSLTHNNKDVSEQTYKKLKEVFPDLNEKLKLSEPAKNGKISVSERLSTLPDDNPLKGKVLAQYDSMLDQQYLAQLRSTLDNYDKYRRSLSRLNIEPWSESWDYYVRGNEIRWRNCVGVLITMILLTFGAPFWFEALSYLIHLRDTLKPKTADGKTENPAGDDPNPRSAQAQKHSDTMNQEAASGTTTEETAGNVMSGAGKKQRPNMNEKSNNGESRQTAPRKKQTHRIRSKQ